MKNATSIGALLILFVASLVSYEASDSTSGRDQEASPHDRGHAGQRHPVTVLTGASIACAQPIFDFGERGNAESVTHDFVIFNQGNQTLTIKNVRTSCGCTVAKPAVQLLPPGTETTVSATFNLHNRNGKQNKTITVESDDHLHPQFALQLSGLAVASILVEPAALHFSNAEEGMGERKVVLRASNQDTTDGETTPNAFKVLSAEVSLAGLSANSSVVEEGQVYEVCVAQATDLPEGAYTGTLTVHTDHPKSPTITVGLSVEISGPLTIQPPKVFLRPAKDPSERSNQLLRVTSGHVKDFELTEIVAPSKSMRAEIQKRYPNDYLIKLTDIPMDGSLDGKDLILKTNLPKAPQISIPFEQRKVPIAPPSTNGQPSGK